MMAQSAGAVSYLETLQNQARQKNLANHPYWHRLLHYRRNLLGVYQSEVDEPSFFLSPRGRKDPAAELDATLAAFFVSASRDPEIQPPPCRYPERYAWLKEQLQFDPSQLPDPSCPRFDRWREQMNAGSVSLIFASAYMNNPSSMYGHTFLRFNSRDQSHPQPILDYAVNFAADVPHDNGVLYAVKGLIGKYEGRFSSMPYYMKVQEYNNLDSRDLWEYELHLTSAAIDRMERHLWELGTSGQPYFFLNKNCSYYLLPLLEVTEPTLRLKDRFVLRTVPVDTIRTLLEQPGLVGSVTRRPSLSTKIFEERQSLTDPEINLVEQLERIPETRNALRVLPPKRQERVLDTAYDLFRYKTGFQRDQPKKVQEQDEKLLLLRNQVSTVKPSFPAVSGGESIINGPPTEALGGDVKMPEFGHASGRLELSYGFSNHSHFEEVSIRPAIHDQDDPPEGYLPGSQLEMFHSKLRYDNDRRTLYLEQFDVINLVSITPWDRWIHPPSWKVNSGLAVANDLNRDPENSLYYGLNLGTGYSAWVPGLDKMLIYGMAEVELELGHAFDHDVRFGGGPSGGVLWTPVRFYRARFQASHFPYATGGTPSTTKVALTQSLSLSKNFDLRAKLERQNAYKEVLISWVWFL